MSSQVTTSNLMSRNSIGVAFTLLSGTRVLDATRASMITLVEPPTVLGSLFMFEILARAD